jgi:RimJ/RimL family protein N-acetyltransferase
VSEIVWRIEESLYTPRLELRAHRMSDLEDLLVFHSDAEVTRYIPWPVRSREQVRAAIETKLTQDVAAAVGEWIVLAIVLRESSSVKAEVVIGEVPLKRGDEGGTLAEVGYVIRADQQGKGLASEAVGGILDFARGLGVTSVVAMVDARNDASAKLLLRRGFTRDASLDHMESDHAGGSEGTDAVAIAASHDTGSIEGFRLAL